MSEKYSDYMNEITKEELYEGLVGYGLFTDVLPPVFTSIDLLKVGLEDFTYEMCDDYIHFDCMRHTGKMRTFGIPTPMTYLQLCDVITQNWDTLQDYFEEKTKMQGFKISRIHLRKMKGEKKLFQMNYHDYDHDDSYKESMLFNDLYVAKYLVKADIKDCFASMDLDALSKALIGKRMAKKNQDPKLYYNQISNLCI